MTLCKGDVVTVILNMEDRSFMLVKKGRVMKKISGIKGRKAMGVLLSNGSVTLLGYVGLIGVVIK